MLMKADSINSLLIQLW